MGNVSPEQTVRSEPRFDLLGRSVVYAYGRHFGPVTENNEGAFQDFAVLANGEAGDVSDIDAEGLGERPGRSVISQLHVGR